MQTLQGQVAIITGGASGIGAATARLFIEHGMRVVIADLQEDAGRTLTAKLGPNATFHLTDVSQEVDMAELFEYVRRHHGRLDCMFNNAGLAELIGPVEEISSEDFDRAVAVHMKGVFLGIKHGARLMKKQQSGSIINTASVAGLRAGYGGHIYSAAKAAVVSMTTSVAMELGECGIRVNCICPGGVATPILNAALGLPVEMAINSERLSPFLAKMQPLRRACLPEDIAQAVLWLASDASSFVNGHALVVDGGLVGGRQWTVGQQQRQLARAALNP